MIVIVAPGDLIFSHLTGTCTRCGAVLRCEKQDAVWHATPCKTTGRWVVACPCCANWGVNEWVPMTPEMEAVPAVRS